MPTTLVLTLDPNPAHPLPLEEALADLLPEATRLAVPWDAHAGDWDGAALQAVIAATGTHDQILFLSGDLSMVTDVRSLLMPALIAGRRVAILRNGDLTRLSRRLGTRYPCVQGLWPLTPEGLQASLAALEGHEVRAPHATPPTTLAGYGAHGPQPLPWMWEPRSERDALQAVRFGRWRPGDPLPPDETLHHQLIALLEHLPDAAMDAGGAEIVGGLLSALLLENDPLGLADLLTAAPAIQREDLLQIPRPAEGGAAHGRLVLLSLLARRAVLTPALPAPWPQLLDSLEAVLPTLRDGLADEGPAAALGVWLTKWWQIWGTQRLPGTAVEPVDPRVHARCLHQYGGALTFPGMLEALRAALDGRNGQDLPDWHVLSCSLGLAPQTPEEWDALDQLVRHRRMTKTRLRGLLMAVERHWPVRPPELLEWIARYRGLGGGTEVALDWLLKDLPATAHSHAVLAAHRDTFPDAAALIDATLARLPRAAPAPTLPTPTSNARDGVSPRGLRI